MWSLRARGLAVALAAAAFAGCGGKASAPVRAGAGCAPVNPKAACSVLFVGNSYTSVNDLPAEFTKLAASAGFPVTTVAQAPGGVTLAGHLANPATATTLHDTTFNVVVLQEQSQIPSSAELAATEMAPAATQLVARVRRAGAEPLLFETWGHRDGWPEAGIASYAQIQTAIDDTYGSLARTLGVDAARVGEAWEKALADPAHPGLWLQDGSHPSPSGTYACSSRPSSIAVRRA